MFRWLFGWLSGWHKGYLYRVHEIILLPSGWLLVRGIFADDMRKAARRRDVQHEMFVQFAARPAAVLRACQVAVAEYAAAYL
jgi:hypothetical protein